MSEKKTHIYKRELEALRREIVVMSPKLKLLVRGKGFSLSELERVGITLNTARSFGIPVDTRRKSLYERNVDLLVKALKKFNIEIKAVAIKPEREDKVGAEKPSIVPPPSIDLICEDFISMIERTKRKKKEILLDVLSKNLKSYANALGREINDDDIRDLFNTIMNDLEMAGYGKVTEVYFSRTDDWDSTMAREIVMERIMKFVNEKLNG